jgi:phosphate transport system substrate-binding protein
MKKLGVGAMAVISALVVAGVFQCENKAKKTIRVFGSTTIEPFVKQAMAEYSKTNDIGFSINAMGSKNGIDSLIAGRCDIAMASTDILPEQMAHATKSGVRIKPFLLGYDIIIPIVHPSNPVSNLTFQQLQEIFEGKITRWSQVGGSDATIDVVDRSDASGTFAIWHHFIVPAMKIPSEIPSKATYQHLMIQPSNSAVMAYIFQHPNAIGYVSNVYLNSEVKPLKLDGISVTESDSMISHYHLKRPLYLFINEDRFGKDLKDFIAFLIISDRGRKLLHEAGFFSSFSLAPLYKAVEKMSKR